MKHLPSLMLAVSLSLIALTAAAADTDRYQVVDGVAIYLGLMPAEMVLGCGERLSGAGIKARVTEFGLPGQEKKLGPMVIADTVTYGNDFAMPNPGPYRINLEIRHATPHSVGTINVG